MNISKTSGLHLKLLVIPGLRPHNKRLFEKWFHRWSRKISSNFEERDNYWGLGPVNIKDEERTRSHFIKFPLSNYSHVLPYLVLVGGYFLLGQTPSFFLKIVVHKKQESLTKKVWNCGRQIHSYSFTFTFPKNIQYSYNLLILKRDKLLNTRYKKLRKKPLQLSPFERSKTFFTIWIFNYNNK